MKYLLPEPTFEAETVENLWGLLRTEGPVRPDDEEGETRATLPAVDLVVGLVCASASIQVTESRARAHCCYARIEKSTQKAIVFRSYKYVQ